MTMKNKLIYDVKTLYALKSLLNTQFPLQQSNANLHAHLKERVTRTNLLILQANQALDLDERSQEYNVVIETIIHQSNLHKEDCLKLILLASSIGGDK